MADKPSQSQPDPRSQGSAKRDTQRQPDSYTAGELSPAALELARQLTALPVAITVVRPSPPDLAARLRLQPRRTVAFPQCADELLSLIRTSIKDEITEDFTDYFTFNRHQIFGQNPATAPGGSPVEITSQLGPNLDRALLNCTNPPILTSPASQHDTSVPTWPGRCCICSSCVTLDGLRNLGSNPVSPGIRRLLIGDLVWLFYMEQLGIFQILGAILDAFAYTGRIPISNGFIDLDIRDDMTALVLEIMVRQTKGGLSSTVRDRAAAFRTSIGWNSTLGKKLNLDTQVNTSFNTLLHKFIYHALEFYKDKRLAVAIQSTAASHRPSAATLITISDTLDVLKNRFEVFDYGRNYSNTLSGIVWAVAAMSVIRELRQTLGIPSAFTSAHELIPAAYDLLVLKRPVTHGDVNRYLVHREAARSGRDLLLDIEVVDHKKREEGGELDAWLTAAEAKVEAYRTAYRNMTGVDIGASATPVIEQQA